MVTTTTTTTTTRTTLSGLELSAIAATNKEKRVIAPVVFGASLPVPRRARHEEGLPAVEADLREAALGGETAADAPGVVGKAPGASAVVARHATGFHVQVGDALAEATNI